MPSPAKKKPVRITRVQPHEGQQAILDGVAEARRRGIRKFVVMAGRRLGKSVLVRDLCLEAMLGGKVVGYWVPSYPDGKSVFKWFVDALGGENSRIISSINKATRRIELIRGGYIDLWAMDTDGSGRGESYDIAVLEEAAKAKTLLSAMDETIEATTLDRKGELWIISSPRGRNAFYDLFLLGQTDDQDFASFRVPSYANPYLSRELLRQIKAGLISRGREWVWRQEYLALPADQGTNPFDLRIIQRQTQDEVEPGPIVAWGIDLAKRQDYTVIVGVKADLRIGSYKRVNKMPWPEQEELIVQTTSAYPDAPILIDSTGVGDPMLDYLKARGVPVQGYHFGGNRRANLLDSYAVSLQRGDAYVLRGQHYLELSKAEYEEKNGKLKIFVPEPDHDDVMMASALAQWQAEKMGYPAIAGSNPIPDRAPTTTQPRRGASRSNLRRYT